MSNGIKRTGGSFTIHPPNADMQTYTANHIYLKNNRVVVGVVADAEEHTGIITIVVAVPADPTQNPSEIKLGEYVLVEGIHWEVDTGSDVNTAINLAASIDNLNEFTATPVGATVEISTTSVDNVVFELVSRTGNMSLSSDSGFLATAMARKINPPTIV